MMTRAGGSRKAKRRVAGRAVANYHEVTARTLLRDSGYTDAWFVGRYGMNLYRGCEHACAYCDGRAERYAVTGSFDDDVAVKTNAPALLAAELAAATDPGFLFVGGGVCDAYQPAERRYGLARQALELALHHERPVHVLTKSALVERDLDLLERSAKQRPTILSFSIQTVNEELRARYEPGAAPLAQRWDLLRRAKAAGLATGVMAMPVLPGLSDAPEQIDALVAEAAQAGVDFLLYSGLTLRPGMQKEHFLTAVAAHRPDLVDPVRRLYRSQRRSGAADSTYHRLLDRAFRRSLTRHSLPARIPQRLFAGHITLVAELAVLLEHEAWALEPTRRGLARSLRRGGQALQRWARALSRGRRGLGPGELEDELRARVADSSLLAVEQIGEPTLAHLRRLLARLPSRRSSAPRQLRLL